jgi:predicted PurR-regulated permease PerM
MTAWPSRDVLRVTLLVAGVYLAFQLLWVARSVFVLGFLGVLFGITLSAGVTWLQRRGLPRAVGAVILMGAVLALLVGLGAVVAPRMTEQWEDLQHQLPQALSQVEQWVREREGGVSRLLQAPSDPAARQTQEPGIRQTVAAQVGKLGANFFNIFSRYSAGWSSSPSWRSTSPWTQEHTVGASCIWCPTAPAPRPARCWMLWAYRSAAGWWRSSSACW